MALWGRKIISGKVTREMTTATETWFCNWNEVITQALKFVGGYQGQPCIWTPPQSFTELPGLKAESCDIEPYGQMSDPNSPTYTTGLLTVNYGILRPSEENNDPNQIYETEFSYSGEGIQLSGNAHYTWGAGPKTSQKVASDIYLTKIIPSCEITCFYGFRPTLPATLATLQGQINNASISIGGQTYTTGQVLYNGASVKAAQSTDGTNGYSRGLKFLVKYGGWNNLWDADDANFFVVSPALYTSASFSPLFES